MYLMNGLTVPFTNTKITSFIIIPQMDGWLSCPVHM